MSQPPKKPPQPQPKSQQVSPALQVFSKTRDIESPYHLEGDMQMYSQQKLQQRQFLSEDEDIKKQISAIVDMYQVGNDNKITEGEYKRMQRKMALSLRPDIGAQELEFVVDEDWKLDMEDGFVTKESMGEKIFEMVDVWTTGVDKMEYITFIKLLAKKIRNIKN